MPMSMSIVDLYSA